MSAYRSNGFNWYENNDCNVVTGDMAAAIISNCLESGEGASVAIHGSSFCFNIRPRQIPVVPPKPTPAPKWKDVKDSMEHDTWKRLKSEADGLMRAYMAARSANAVEKKVRSRLSKLQAVVERI